MPLNYDELPHVQLAIMSRGYVLSRALHAIAKLGIANFMSDEYISVHELAEKSHTNVNLLDRILRFLSAYGLFKRAEDKYALTALSKPLRDDDAYSLRDVLCMVDDSWWQAFSYLDESLQTGESAFSIQHGDDFFSFLSKNPEKQANFDRGMAKLSTYDDDKIAASCDFSVFKHLVDMGGGRGGLSLAIAHRYPNLTVTLFDTPVVINQLHQHDFPANVKLQQGDFLKDIPQADAYIFKGVLHDFSDELMQDILQNCSKRMPNDATLVIAEQVMPDDEKPHPNKTMDIVMMVLLNGRQRTLTEWRQAVQPAGFHYKNHYPTDSLFTVMTFQKDE